MPTIRGIWLYSSKYYGRPIDKVPTSHLQEVMDKAEIKKFARIAWTELKFRTCHNCHVEDAK